MKQNDDGTSRDDNAHTSTGCVFEGVACAFYPFVQTKTPAFWWVITLVVDEDLRGDLSGNNSWSIYSIYPERHEDAARPERKAQSERKMCLLAPKRLTYSTGLRTRFLFRSDLRAW